MEIEPAGLTKVLNNYQNQGEKNKAQVEKAQNKDEISLSETARDFQKVQQEIDYNPPVREEKVAELKQQIEAGNYSVDGEKVAAKMLDQIIDRRV